MAAVLALDGDENTVERLQQILEAFDHVVERVATVSQLLSALDRGVFDLILIDILMEGLDAQAAVSDILARQPEARIVAVTAYPKQALSRAVLGAGAHSLMGKPFEIGKLLNLLSEAKA